MRLGIRKLLQVAGEFLPEIPQPAAGQKTAAQKRSRPAPNRHSRKCSVCRHPDRAEIEQDFLHWRSPDRIARDYAIADHSSVYRHAHATGLYEKRAGMVRLALGQIIEQADTVKVTAGAIVNAVEVFARLDDSGRWIRATSNRQTPGLKRRATR